MDFHRAVDFTVLLLNPEFVIPAPGAYLLGLQLFSILFVLDSVLILDEVILLLEQPNCAIHS